MSDIPQARLAQFLAIGVPAALLGGAYISEYVFGLYPCEMCWWQRWPHFAALGLAGISVVAPPRRVWIALAGIAVLVSGVIGAHHAGVEYQWWQGFTGCATTPTGLDVMDPTAVPLIRCDVAPWTLFGVSLAGWNFLFSSAGGITILTLLARKETA
ncbi:MAG: disulfide bond formation protein B [Pseudomonadota bacterium]